jgi:hypothetical protein
MYFYQSIYLLEFDSEIFEIELIKNPLPFYKWPRDFITGNSTFIFFRRMKGEQILI